MCYELNRCAEYSLYQILIESLIDWQGSNI